MIDTLALWRSRGALRRHGWLVALLLTACSPAGGAADGGLDAASGPRDSGVDLILNRPDIALLDTGLLDAAENDGAMRAMTSRDCVRSSAGAWTTTTRVEATRPDGRCPDRVRVHATASTASVCGPIEACCDYFADCLFEVELDLEHTVAGRSCPAPNRRAMLRCRCVNNRVECDPERQFCPMPLPAGWTCSARAGEPVFGVARCSDCAGSGDAGPSDAGDAPPDAARD